MQNAEGNADSDGQQRGDADQPEVLECQVERLRLDFARQNARSSPGASRGKDVETGAPNASTYCCN